MKDAYPGSRVGDAAVDYGDHFLLFKELIERRGCALLYLLSYSPDCNPIEQAFSKIKALVRRAEARTRASDP
jgi:hypothetical protein